MLAEFLDVLEIKHDGRGGVDGDLPAELDEAKVKTGVEKLLANHPAGRVAVYLHLFQLQQPGGWPALTAELENNPALKLG